MEKAVPTNPSSQTAERDDLLGKNQCRHSVNGNAPGGPFRDKPPYRKRTEDLDDSL